MTRTRSGSPAVPEFWARSWRANSVVNALLLGWRDRELVAPSTGLFASVRSNTHRAPIVPQMLGRGWHRRNEPASNRARRYGLKTVTTLRQAGRLRIACLVAGWIAVLAMIVVGCSGVVRGTA